MQPKKQWSASKPCLQNKRAEPVRTKRAYAHPKKAILNERQIVPSKRPDSLRAIPGFKAKRSAPTRKMQLSVTKSGRFWLEIAIIAPRLLPNRGKTRKKRPIVAISFVFCPFLRPQQRNIGQKTKLLTNFPLIFSFDRLSGAHSTRKAHHEPRRCSANLAKRKRKHRYAQKRLRSIGRQRRSTP